jgi:hypothetical protein
VVGHRDSYGNYIDGWDCASPAITTYLPYIPSGWTTYSGKASGNAYGTAANSFYYPNGEPVSGGGSGNLFSGNIGAVGMGLPQNFNNIAVGGGLSTNIQVAGNGVCESCGGNYNLTGSFYLTACQSGYTATGDGICTPPNGTINVVSVNAVTLS